MAERQDWPEVPGEYRTGTEDSPVAIAVIGKASADVPSDCYRIMGTLRSANIGVEKVVVNMLANPRLRFLLVCGREDGHYPGDALVKLAENGIDDRNNIIGAHAQFPCLPDLDRDSVERFRSQVEVVDLLHPKDSKGDIDWEDPLYVFDDERNRELEATARQCARRDPGPYPGGALHITIPGMMQERGDLGDMLNMEVGRMTDLMLRMPIDNLTTDALNITVSEDFALVIDPIDGLLLEVPTVTFHKRFKSYLTGNE